MLTPEDNGLIYPFTKTLVGFDEFTIQRHMQHVRGLVAEGVERGFRPFAAIAVLGDEIIGEAYNQAGELDGGPGANPTLHAERLLVDQVTESAGPEALQQSLIVINADPCDMCINSLFAAHAGRKLVVGAPAETNVGTFRSDMRRNLRQNKGLVQLCIRGVDRMNCRVQIEQARKARNARFPQDKDEAMDLVHRAEKQASWPNLVHGGQPWTFHTGNPKDALVIEQQLRAQGITQSVADGDGIYLGNGEDLYRHMAADTLRA